MDKLADKLCAEQRNVTVLTSDTTMGSHGRTYAELAEEARGLES